MQSLLDSTNLSKPTLANVASVAFHALVVATVTLGVVVFGTSGISWLDGATNQQTFVHVLNENRLAVVTAIASVIYGGATIELACDRVTGFMLGVWIVSLYLVGKLHLIVANIFMGAGMPVFEWHWSDPILPAIVATTWIATRIVVAQSQANRHSGWSD